MLLLLSSAASVLPLAPLAQVSRASASCEIILPLGWALGGVCALPSYAKHQILAVEGLPSVRDNQKRKSARYSLCTRKVRCAEALLLDACTVALQEGAMKVL